MRHQTFKQMNRPFGAVDISANLKGAVPKATTAKILVSLADKGAIVQKTYGICSLKLGYLARPERRLCRQDQFLRHEPERYRYPGRERTGSTRNGMQGSRRGKQRRRRASKELAIRLHENLPSFVLLPSDTPTRAQQTQRHAYGPRTRGPDRRR